MTSSLTSRQAQVLEWIRRRIAESGMPPTRAEIASRFGFNSPNAAEMHLRALARKGAIALSQGTARGIRLLETGVSPTAADIAGSPARKRYSDPGFLPLVGRVAAGQPVLAQEHIEQEVPVDPAMFRPRADYLLRVQGLSLRDAGILDGD